MSTTVLRIDRAIGADTQLHTLPDAKPNDLDWIHGQLQGYMELVGASDQQLAERIIILGNDVARVNGMPATAYRWDGTVLHGPLLVMGCTAGGNHRGLTPAEQERVRLIHRRANWPAVLMLDGGRR